MNAEDMAEPMNLHTSKWLLQMAKQKKCAVMGSVIIKEHLEFFNRILFATPDGDLFEYDKKHLFTFAGENDYYTAGTEIVTIEYKGWKIRPLICYDLRFPVWSRNTEKNPYDLLVYVANWPKPRISAWSSLLNARAVENAAYCIGINRTGKDDLEIEYNGQSAVHDYMGNKILDCGEQEGIYHTDLSYQKLISFRQKFPVLKDQDKFTLS
jgi:predicted amidohydrolase